MFIGGSASFWWPLAAQLDPDDAKRDTPGTAPFSFSRISDFALYEEDK